MITLASGDVLAAKAGTGSVITVSLKLDAITPATAANSFQTAQAVLAAATTTIYVSTSVQTVIREMSLVNTSGSDVTGVTFYLNTNLTSTQLTSGFTIPANGMATYCDGALRIFSAAGLVLSTTSLLLTGDVTGSGSGTIATTLANIPNDVAMAGDLLSTAIAAPATPAAGKGRVYVDSTSKNIAVKDDAGVVKHGVQTKAAVASNFLTAISDAGVVSAAQPAASDVSGLATIATSGSANDLTAGTLLAGRFPALTGDVTTVAGSLAATIAANAVTNAKTATMAAHTYKGNITGSTAVPTDIGAAALVADLVTNGGLVEGLSNVIDVTQTGPYVVNAVLPGNTAANNNTFIAAILTAAPTGSTIFFPGGTYSFASKITVPAKVFTFAGQGSNLTGGYTLLNWSSNVGDNLIQLTGGNWYTQFYNLTMTVTASQTAGAAIAIGDNVSCNINDCTFAGQGATTFFNVLDFTGTSSGENTVISNVTISKFTNIGINISGALTSPVLFAVVISGQWGTSTQCAAAGVQIQNAGAVLIDDCDVIGCVNNLLINPTTSIVVASVYVMNTYFDNSLGSCIKITGLGASVRCRFIACSFTTSNAGTAFSAVEITTTVTAGAQGIDFENCSILNTFGTTGTTNGFLITGAADFSIIACRIAAWTNGINITPFNSNGKTQPMIEDNTIGPTGGYGANSVGILLNAGAVQYGAIMIQNNQLQGNTTPMTDSSTIATSTQKIISGNGGLVSGTSKTVANVATVTTTVETIVLQLPIPANSLTVGQIFRVTLAYHPLATSIITARARVGTAGTTGDTAVQTLSATPLTQATMRFASALLVVTAVGASATVMGTGFEMIHAGSPAIGAGGVVPTNSIAFNSTVANFLSISLQNTTSTTTSVYVGLLEAI